MKLNSDSEYLIKVFISMHKSEDTIQIPVGMEIATCVNGRVLLE